MEVFGPRWKITGSALPKTGKRVTDDDTVLIAGDTSWAMRLDEAQEDLDQIRALPGKKSSSAATMTTGGPVREN